MPMNQPSILDTCQQIIGERIPNLFRLYVNPYVAQSCFCLVRLVEAAWRKEGSVADDYQVFLANGMDEALSESLRVRRRIFSRWRERGDTDS
jgi:hypothetical protein